MPDGRRRGDGGRIGLEAFNDAEAAAFDKLDETWCGADESDPSMDEMDILLPGRWAAFRAARSRAVPRFGGGGGGARDKGLEKLFDVFGC